MLPGITFACAGSIRAFFRGNGANVVKIAPETALKLSLNDAIRSAIAADPDHVLVRERMVSGGLAGAVAQVRVHGCACVRGGGCGVRPMEGAIEQEAHRGGARDTLHEVAQNTRRGVVHQRNIGAGLYRDVPPAPPVPPAAVQGLLYPLDTIRTRLALAPNGAYRGILHAMYRIKRDEGARAFYRGLAPSMVGILPFAGVDIALFEVLKVGLRVVPSAGLWVVHVGASTPRCASF